MAISPPHASAGVEEVAVERKQEVLVEVLCFFLLTQFCWKGTRRLLQPSLIAYSLGQLLLLQYIRSISVDGINAKGRAGGGSGGSVYICASTIEGSGTISAVCLISKRVSELI
jgi:hypothetical protein